MPDVGTNIDLVVALPKLAVTRLDAYVVGFDSLLRTRFDLAVYAAPRIYNNTTRPEGFRYRDCRPAWCNVSRVLTKTVSMDMIVGAEQELETGIDMAVQAEYSQYLHFDVSIQIEEP